MEYRTKKRRQKKARAESRTILAEVSDLREILLEFEPLLTRACEGIEEIAAMIYNELHPQPFPDPLYDGPSQQLELSSNGLVVLSCGKENDVPF